jgi:hypothetical protein
VFRDVVSADRTTVGRSARDYGGSEANLSGFFSDHPGIPGRQLFLITDQGWGGREMLRPALAIFTGRTLAAAHNSAARGQARARKMGVVPAGTAVAGKWPD